MRLQDVTSSHVLAQKKISFYYFLTRTRCAYLGVRPTPTPANWRRADRLYGRTSRPLRRSTGHRSYHRNRISTRLQPRSASLATFQLRPRCSCSTSLRGSNPRLTANGNIKNAPYTTVICMHICVKNTKITIIHTCTRVTKGRDA